MRFILLLLFQCSATNLQLLLDLNVNIALVSQGLASSQALTLKTLFPLCPVLHPGPPSPLSAILNEVKVG